MPSHPFGISLPGVADDNLSYAARAHDGRLFGVVLVAVALGVFGIALAAAGRAAPSRRLERRVVRLVGVAAGVVVVALAGNATMTALVLGIDPEPLGVAPFILSTHTPPEVLAGELGLPVHPGARAYVFPALGAYVGGGRTRSTSGY